MSKLKNSLAAPSGPSVHGRPSRMCESTVGHELISDLWSKLERRLSSSFLLVSLTSQILPFVEDRKNQNPPSVILLLPLFILSLTRLTANLWYFTYNVTDGTGKLQIFPIRFYFYVLPVLLPSPLSALSRLPWFSPVKAVTSVLFIFHVFSLHFWQHPPQQQSFQHNPTQHKHTHP